MSQAAAAPRATRDHVLIAISAALALSRILAVSAPQGANDRSRWATVVALVEHGTYAIGQRLRSSRGPLDLGLVEALDLRTVDRVLHPQRQRFYSSKPTLLPTMVAAEYALLRALFGWQLQRDSKKVVVVVLLTFNWLPLLLYLLLFERLLRRHCHEPWVRSFVMGCACFATFVTSFVVTLNNHTVATYGVMAALYLLATLDARPAARRGSTVAIAGLCAGWAASADLPATALCVALAVLLARRDLRLTLVWFVPAAVLPVGAQLLTNVLAIGTVKPAYYHASWYRYAGSYWLRRRGVDRVEPSRLRYALHFLVGHHGVLSLSPMYLLSLLGGRGTGLRDGLLAGLLAAGTFVFGLTYRRYGVVWVTVVPLCAALFIAPLWRAERTLQAAFRQLVLVCSVSTLAFYIASTDSYGGIAIGPRWLIWLTPLWLLAMIPAAQRWAARGTLGKGAMLALGALSAWSSQRSPLDPWQHPWLYGLL